MSAPSQQPAESARTTHSLEQTGGRREADSRGVVEDIVALVAKQDTMTVEGRQCDARDMADKNFLCTSW